MRSFIVLITLLICFLSLLGVITVAQTFGFSPEQFHDPDSTLKVGTMLTALAILLVPIFIVALVQRFIHKRKLLELGFRSNPRQYFVIYFGLGACIKIVALAVAYAYANDSVISSNISGIAPGELLPYFFWFIFTLLLNSINEEIVYRAYPFEILREKLTPLVVIIAASFVFSVMHFLIEPPGLMLFLYRLFFGIVAGILYAQNRSIWSVVGLHTGWNLIALGVNEGSWKSGVFLRISGLQENSEMIANIGVLFIVSIFLFKRVNLRAEGFGGNS